MLRFDLRRPGRAPTPSLRPTLVVPISPGELLDRFAVLSLKADRIADPAKAARARARRDALAPLLDEINLDAVATLDAELLRVNSNLWDVFQEQLALESAGDLGPRYVELAQRVNRLNDRRCDIKTRIDRVLSCPPGEGKDWP
jgi:hypothetical protein